MNKLLFGLLLLVSGFAMAVETCDYVDESLETDQVDFVDDDSIDPNRALDEWEIWKTQLDQFLISQDNINVAISGMSHLDMLYDHRVDAVSRESLLGNQTKLKLINQLAESEMASFESLMKAQSMCSNEVDCPNEAIQARLEQLYPDNITVYFHPLQQALVDEDLELVAAILKRMGQTEYGQTLYKVDENYSHLVEAYIENHSAPEESPDQLYLEESGVESDEIDLDSLSFGSIMISEKILSYIFGPGYGSIYKACEMIPSSKSDCISAAEIMISKSDSIMMTTVGYGLLEKAYELSGDEKELASVKDERESFDTYWQCLAGVQSLGEGLDIFTDSKVQELYLNGTHEGLYLEQMALYLYEKYQAKGVEGLTDPKSCGLRYVNK